MPIAWKCARQSAEALQLCFDLGVQVRSINGRDPVADYYYWFTADVVIVDASWVDYVP